MSGTGYFDVAKKQGYSWYVSYAGRKRRGRNVILVTPHARPVLSISRSIYPRRQTYDKTVSVVSRYYEDRGIKTIIVGPSGLGAGGGIELLGTVIALIIKFKAIISLIPVVYKVSMKIYGRYKIYKEDQYAKELRATRDVIELSISLYVEDDPYPNDMVPYMQELVDSSVDLCKKLEKEIPYINYYLSYSVIDGKSGKSISVMFPLDVSKKICAKIVKKLSGVNASSSTVQITVDKKIFWHKITINKYR